MTIKELKEQIYLIHNSYDNVRIKDVWMNEDKIIIEFEDIVIK